MGNNASTKHHPLVPVCFSSSPEMCFHALKAEVVLLVCLVFSSNCKRTSAALPLSAPLPQVVLEQFLQALFNEGGIAWEKNANC